MNKLLIGVGLVCVAAPSVAMAQPRPGDTIIVVDPQAMPGGPPSAIPPGQPAPQNESWDNVSHVNGTPIPVGTRNDYLYTFRRTIISSNPVGWMFGFYGVSVTVALSENIAIRGDVNRYDADGLHGSEVGIGLPLYLRRTYQGPFVEPGLISRSEDGDDSVAGPQVLLGWQWTYESGFSLAMAAGFGRDVAHSSDDGVDAFFNGYFRIGYGF